ncbi:hypothetical protein DPMN_083192 [Dreissena polymorpha]|uniref:Uncharacterized protein n=1 Tax=Dreissena polymorpha TaxID=45954 RepID=A0A9D3YCC1_DREPO|nr:hypothetical protein DPMN_083192 [Dreissena polymorpha]
MGTNILTKCHEDWKMNVASRVLTRKKAPHHDIIGTNLLTKFHEVWTINVASRITNAPPSSGHVFQRTRPFSNSFNIYRTIYVASRLSTRQMLTLHNTQWSKGDHKSSP